MEIRANSRMLRWITVAILSLGLSAAASAQGSPSPTPASAAPTQPVAAPTAPLQQGPEGPSAAPAQPTAQPASAPETSASTEANGGRPNTDYRLGVADKVRMIVFNEPTLTGEYLVNSNGDLAVPLVGDVKAAGRTTRDLQADIENRFRAGYLRDPHVSIEVLTFRPFFILGEVQKPGQYPFSTGLTVLNAVATAQGFTYRADMHHVYIRSAGEPGEHKYRLTSTTPVQPGDTIRIGERYF
jgi:protein involved in polysaccharide export with SLBB domain